VAAAAEGTAVTNSNPGDLTPRQLQIRLTELRDWLWDLMQELEQDSSGDWHDQDLEGLGWERACHHYAGRIREKLHETAEPESSGKSNGCDR
jgi:hypothetical protein